MSDQTKAVAVIKAVSLISGNDAKVASELIKGFNATQKAGRVIAAFGLYAWHVKMVKLKRGDWGNWLATHAPTLCRRDQQTGVLIPKASSALNTYMGLTSDILADMGYTLKKWFAEVANSHAVGIVQDGKFILAPTKKLPEPVAVLQKQIHDRVDNKTLKQMRLSFSQVEEDEETGDLRTKKGRAKGSTGLTKAMRDAAKERAERERIEDLELGGEDNWKWLEKNCDDKGVGSISPKKAERLLEGVEYARTYLINLKKQRTGQ